MSFEKRIVDKLLQRRGENQLRSLQIANDLVDFSSNDYLGLAKTYSLIDPVQAGSGGSRLLTGNYSAIEQLEFRVARIANAEAALVYSSGYAANVGLLSCLPQRGDVILYDELVHASIRDGIRLSHANAYSFGHNNFEELEKRLEKYAGESEVFVVVESVYSMDGDSVDIEVIKKLHKKYDFNLLIDEAHSFGLSRKDDFQRELSPIAVARIVTFGKAFGADGAAVLGSAMLREYLINYSRSFIYSTGPSPHKIALLNAQLDQWEVIENLNKKSKELKAYFVATLGRQFEMITSEYGNIIGVIIGNVDKVKQCSVMLRRGGLDVRPILSPTVPKGTERLRICFHEFNTQDEVDRLVSLLVKFKNEEG